MELACGDGNLSGLVFVVNDASLEADLLFSLLN